MKIIIGSDHAGFELKELIKSKLESENQSVIDVGAYKFNKVDDYPDFSEAVGRAVAGGQGEKGILICGSGVGASIAANKIKGVRACLCHDIYSATQGVEHDNMNILCLGGLIIGRELAFRLVDGFIQAQFIPNERFIRRLEKIIAMET